MKLNIDQQLKTMEGLKDPTAADANLSEKACPRCGGSGNLSPSDPDYAKAENRPVTMRRLMVNALMSLGRGEENLAGEEKARRGELARRIFTAPDGAELVVKSEDVTLIKELIGKRYNQLVVMQAWPILDDDEAKK